MRKDEILEDYSNMLAGMEWTGKHSGTKYFTLLYPDQEHCLVFNDREGDGDYHMHDVIYTIKEAEALKKLVAGK